MQTKELFNLQPSEVIENVGLLFTKDETESGISACVSLAQFILESGYGKTELAQNANNCFGMKIYLSGNSWTGSTWDGVGYYQIETDEYDENNQHYVITAKFRKYSCIEDSIADHSAYLNGAMNGNRNRYDGLKGEKDYKKAIQIIKDGGYATDPMYVDKICEIIQKWDLVRFNVDYSTTLLPEKEKEIEKEKYWYRIRKSWDDPSSQLAAYLDLELAKKFVDNKDGYFVFDTEGNKLYPLCQTTKKKAKKNKKE